MEREEAVVKVGSVVLPAVVVAMGVAVVVVAVQAGEGVAYVSIQFLILTSLQLMPDYL